MALNPGTIPPVRDRAADEECFSARRPSGFLVALLWIQGLYFVATGIWPILSIETFESITGEKTDDWLVQTVGALIAVIGLVFLVAGARRRMYAEIAVLAIGSAATLLLVDVIFVVAEVIPPIYLADAVAEVILIVAWAYGLSRWIGGYLRRPPRREHVEERPFEGEHPVAVGPRPSEAPRT